MAHRPPIQRAPVTRSAPDLVTFRALINESPNLSVDIRVRVAEYQSPHCWDSRSGFLVEPSKWLSYILRHGLPSRTYPEFFNLPIRADGFFLFHLLWGAPVATLSTKCDADIVRCYMAIRNNPKRRFELVLEEAAALAAAEDVQWRIYAQQEIWRLQDHPLCHGHQDVRISMIRAVQGHSGARVNVSLFTRELHLEDEELPLECLHGTQGPLESIIRHGDGLSPSGATPTRAPDMIHFAVSLPSRPRGLPQLAALHRHRRFMISFNLPAWLEDNRRHG